MAPRECVISIGLLTSGTQLPGQGVLFILTSFWLLHIPESLSNYLIEPFSTFFVNFKCFSVISRLKNKKQYFFHFCLYIDIFHYLFIYRMLIESRIVLQVTFYLIIFSDFDIRCLFRPAFFVLLVKYMLCISISSWGLLILYTYILS